jgi:hypothetical protein
MQLREVALRQRVRRADAGAFGRPVDIDQTRSRVEEVEQSLQLGFRVTLAAKDEAAHRRPGVGPKLAHGHQIDQQRRHREPQRAAAFADLPHEVGRRADDLASERRQRCTREQRCVEVEDGIVEVQRIRPAQPVAGADAEFRARPVDEVEDAGVGDGNALGCSRGAGGEHQVRRVAAGDQVGCRQARSGQPIDDGGLPGAAAAERFPTGSSGESLRAAGDR